MDNRLRGSRLARYKGTPRHGRSAHRVGFDPKDFELQECEDVCVEEVVVDR